MKKLKASRTKQAVIALAVCALSATMGFVFGSSKTVDSQTNERPEVIIKQGQKLPLEIIAIKPDMVTTETPEVELVVANKGSQPIIAYAIRYDTISRSSKAGGYTLVNSPSMSKALQPGQEVTGTVGDGVTYSDPIRKIYIYVDYVQLGDGSELGPDRSKASEILAGQRAGAKLFGGQIRNLLKKNNTASIMSLIEQEGFDPVPPPNATPRWVQGFRAGIGILKDRLKQAYQNKGADDLEIELNKPFDAFEER